MPKSKEQFEQIKKQRIKAIEYHALYLFALHGFDGVTTDDITKAVGCSHGLLFHYFKSKEELFKDVVNNIVNNIDKEITLNIPIHRDHPKEVLRDYLEAYLSALRSKRNDYACAIYLLLNLYIQSRKISETNRQDFKYSIFENIYRLIDKGKELGEFIDYSTRELTVTLVSLLKGLSYNRINLGYGNCTIPSSDLLMNIVLKNNERRD